MLVSRPLTGVADVEIVGGGVTGISCALTLAQAGKRVRLHEARAVASGASGRNGGFALRGGAMAYDSAREWLGHEQAAEYWRLTEAYVGRMGKLGGGAFRRTGSLRLAGDDEREDLRVGVRGAARGRFCRRMARRAARAARRSLPGSALPSRRRRAAARAARSADGRPRGRSGRRDPRARSRRGSGRARGRDDRRRHRRVSERPARRARRADHPNPRPDDRDRAVAGAAVPDAALRPARLRLLAPGRGRDGSSRAASATSTSSPSSRPRRRRRRGSRARSTTSSSRSSAAGPK